MLKKLALAALAVVLLAPALVLIAIGVLMDPAANASCTTGTGDGVTVGNVPDELAVTTADGTRFTLTKKQLTRAATIIEVGNDIDRVGRDGIQIALMAALTESTLRMQSNTSAYPESGSYPNDGDGGDHDSLGLFQMRPSTGWGTVADLMDPTYQARAFFGGPDGPNGGSPRGLLDIPGWQQIGKGEAARAVEVSAYPDRYDNYAPVAVTILDALTRTTTGAASTAQAATTPATKRAEGAGGAESSRVVFHLPEGTWVLTSPFGPRIHPVTGEPSFHTGTDFAAPDGTPILAVADGTVTVAEFSGAYGNLIVIEHTIDGKTLATAYARMWDHGIHVAAGDRVTAGRHIGDGGSSGRSTGPHLHFEVRPGSTKSEAIDPASWLNQHHAADLPEPETSPPAGCGTMAPGGEPEPVEGDPDRLVDDPTSDGQITARMLNLYQQTITAFPDTSWTCYSPRPGTTSEHPLGRACDGTFGIPVGQHPTPAQRELGWQVTDWMKDHAEVHDVEYLIWKGKSGPSHGTARAGATTTAAACTNPTTSPAATTTSSTSPSPVTSRNCIWCMIHAVDVSDGTGFTPGSPTRVGGTPSVR